MAEAKPKAFMLLFKYHTLSKGSTVTTKLLTLHFQTTLMPEMQKLDFPTGKAFVRQSATIYSVLMYSKMTSLRYTRSLAK